MAEGYENKPNSNFITSSTGIDTTGSSATAFSYYIDSSNDLCILTMDVTTNALSENSWKLIGILPIGKRPVHTLYFSSLHTIWSINTNGNINVYSPWGGITLIAEYVQVSYPI